MHVAYVVVLLRAKRHATDNNTLTYITITLKHNKTLVPLDFTNHKVANCELV
jgi:hypothetical protein